MMGKVVKVDFEGEEYEFYLRYMTMGERKEIIKRSLTGEFPNQGVDIVTAEALLRAVTIDRILKNGEEIYKYDGDLSKAEEFIANLPEKLLKSIDEYVVDMNPL